MIMPLPAALGAKRKVSQRSAASAGGRISSASQPLCPTQARFHSSALSASQAKPSDTRATSAAPPSNRPICTLLRDSRLIWRSLRRARWRAPA